MNITTDFLDHKPRRVSLAGLSNHQGHCGQNEEESRECQRIDQKDAKAQKNESSLMMRPPSSLKRKTVLPETFSPTKYSVVCGRTQDCYNHTGNRRFRVTVKMFLNEYAEADGKAEKSRVVSNILDIIREASPEGSFVTFEKGRWYEVSDRVAREKIGAQFRDYLHSQYRSSAKAKQARKVAKAKMQQYQNLQFFANVSTMPNYKHTPASGSEFSQTDLLARQTFGIRDSYSL